MENQLVTIVVPVYNVEKYLDRCVESIVNQTYTNLEILLIDDGSPDNCPRICDEWARRDSRIRVIHKENQGLGMARNTGIENATGEYICFFDSDDYVSPDLIRKALEKILQEQADIVIYGYVMARPEKDVYVPLIPVPNQEVYQGDEVVAHFLPEYLGDDPVTGKPSFIPSGACAAMYSMNLIRRTGWRFVSERDLISEDIYSHLMLYKDVKKVAILKESLYYYCENPASLTHTYRDDRQRRVNHQYHMNVALCRANGYPEQVLRRCMEPALAATMEILKQEIARSSTCCEALSRTRRILSDETFQQILRAKKKDRTNPKRRLFLWAARCRFGLLCYLLILAQRITQK